VQWRQIVTFNSVQRHPGLTYRFLISDIRALWRSREHQSARMSEIKIVA